jgi:ribA/ribD-fused uncharacterized protein
MFPFEDEFGFLSNFYPSSFVYAGVEWKTVEHAYQADKTKTSLDRETIRAAPTPGRARRIGKRIELRDHWDEEKVPLMMSLVFEKFTQNLELRELLLMTEGIELVEENWWHDNFWGVCTCPSCSGHGENMLGTILMKLREAFRKESQ